MARRGMERRRGRWIVQTNGMQNRRDPGLGAIVQIERVETSVVRMFLKIAGETHGVIILPLNAHAECLDAPQQ